MNSYLVGRYSLGKRWRELPTCERLHRVNPDPPELPQAHRDKDRVAQGDDKEELRCFPEERPTGEVVKEPVVESSEGRIVLLDQERRHQRSQTKPQHLPLPAPDQQYGEGNEWKNKEHWIQHDNVEDSRCRPGPERVGPRDSVADPHEGLKRSARDRKPVIATLRCKGKEPVQLGPEKNKRR